MRYREGREWAELSYEDLGRRVREIARGLIALGVEPGDRVAIFSDTRVEWTLCDLGALCAGAVVAPIYHTNSSAEARHVLEDSGARVVFCGGRAQQGNVEEVREELSALEHVVLFEGGEPAVSDDEEATGEVLDEDGWLHTGDVGSFDEDGFLSITGRKKDILVTSSGENVPAPAVEARIAASRWASNAVVYGNDKNYVVALVTIDEDERDALGEETGTRQQNRDLMARQMTEDDNVRLEIQEAVDEANRDLAHVLQVKKFAILDHDLAQQEDEITPTMKIKRDVVYERYRDVFEGLYEDDEEQ